MEIFMIQRYVIASLAWAALLVFAALALHASQIRTEVSIISPQQAQRPRLANHIWAFYRSAKLGFSVEYPSSFLTQEGGIGEEDTVAFIHKTSSNETDSVIQVNVDVTSASSAIEEVDSSKPYIVTRLAGLPATQQEEGNGSCPECIVRFISVFKGKRYMINISNSSLSTSPLLSKSDVERIRSSFSLTEESR